MGWVSVKDKLPDDDVTVLAVLEDSTEPVWLAYHDGDGWNDIGGGAVRVTHWQPIPEAPR